MADNKLVGQNYTTPDMVAKVTGRAKFAEDFRAEGMLFARQLLSPMPHARVTRIDASAALAMPGVKAMLTADDLPKPAWRDDRPRPERSSRSAQRAGADDGADVPGRADPRRRRGGRTDRRRSDRADRHRIRAAALRHRSAWRVCDPAAPTRAPTATSGCASRAKSRPARSRRSRRRGEVDRGRLRRRRRRRAADGQAGRRVDLRRRRGWLQERRRSSLDETFVTPNVSHQTLEPRTAMAYWQNGKLYMHCSTQSTVQTVAAVAALAGITPDDVVVISEYTGGGFGSKITGDVSMAIPALLSKKTNAPVMMRISREEEHYMGGARPAFHGRVKAGFTKDGKLTALDLFVISDNGPYESQGDGAISGSDHAR